MILPDVNILIHAVDADSHKNERIRTWWDQTLSEQAPVFLAWAVILGFVRTTTNPRILGAPLSIGDAAAYVDAWLGQSPVRIVSPQQGHWTLVKKLLQDAGTAGNLTTDAHLAALAIQWDCVLYSTDADFARFHGLKWKQM